MKKGTVLSLKRIRLSEFIIKNNVLVLLEAAVYRRYSGGNLCRGKDSRIVGLFGGLS